MTRSCGDIELDQKPWDKTLLEAERVGMRGPLDWEELDCGATLSRTFPLVQVFAVGGGALLQIASIMLFRRLCLLHVSGTCNEHAVHLVPYAGYSRLEL